MCQRKKKFKAEKKVIKRSGLKTDHREKQESKWRESMGAASSLKLWDANRVKWHNEKSLSAVENPQKNCHVQHFFSRGIQMNLKKLLTQFLISFHSEARLTKQLPERVPLHPNPVLLFSIFMLIKITFS